MGNPWFSDDGGAMCFNAAKTWQIGWYDSNKVLIDPRSGSWTGRVIGVADFNNNPGNHPVVLKIESRTSKDLFVAFNRATGVNRETRQAKDQVTVIEVQERNGEGYSQSYLKRILSEGQSYRVSNWAGSGQTLTVRVNDIIIGNRSFANISVCLGSCGQSPTPSPPSPSPPTGGNPSYVSYTNGAYSNKCLDLSHADKTNGNDIWLWPCNGTSAQKWKLDSNGFLRSQLNQNKCMVPVGKAELHADIVIWDCSDRFTYMKWRRDSRGRFVLRADASKCLDVTGNDGRALQIWECNDRPDKIWNVA